LSKSQGWEMIKLLRDFDDKIFMKHPSQHLWAEESHLDTTD
jgi:hypothetical protein